VIIIAAPIAGRIMDRIGAKVPIAVGLTLVSVALFLQSRITVDSGYGELLPTFSMMGLGVGLTMSPMSAAAMNAVNEAKAGVASGILSMSRMVGGTFGVAAVGALFQTLADHRLGAKLAGLPISGAQKEWLADNLGSKDVGSVLSGLDPEAARRTDDALRETFVYALSSAMKLSTVVAALGAAIALAQVEGKRRRRPAQVQPAGAQDVAHPALAQADSRGDG
jgi:MFS family permease